MSLWFRNAERKDTRLILQFIRELAEYEKMLDDVVADEATLEEWIFDKEKAEVIFAMEGDKEVGFALFFHNFSDFVRVFGGYIVGQQLQHFANTCSAVYSPNRN